MFTHVFTTLLIAHAALAVPASVNPTPTFAVGCTGAGAVQLADFTNLTAGTAAWFSAASSKVGPSCSTTTTLEAICTAPDPTDGCGYNGTYIVYAPHDAACSAFQALEETVQFSCASQRLGDCGCGIYQLGASGSKCLVASFTYHVEGPSTISPQNIPQEPGPVTVDVNPAPKSKRSFTDLTVCEHTRDGDISGWCEGKGTHVCPA